MRKKSLYAIGLLTALAATVLFLGLRGAFNGPPKPIHHEERVGDLLYVIDLEQDVYKRGEIIRVNAAVTNLGDVPLTYISGSSSCPRHVSVDIIHEKRGEPVRLAPAPTRYGCTSDLNSSTLEPGQSETNEYGFITRYWEIDSKSAPAGTYRVHFKMARADESFFAKGKPEPEEKFAGSSFTIRIR